MLLILLLLLGLNFFISWSNAHYVGRYWSESKEVGGSFRFEILCGYVMAVAGFTMVYGYILILLAPVILPLFNVSSDVVMRISSLSGDLLYLLVGLAVILSGVRIWIQSLRAAWENRSFSYLATAGWNSYAQISNTINFARNAPSAFQRVCKALFGEKGGRRSSSSKKKDTAVVYVAIILVVLAVFGGYFTADAIMKRADEEYDLFNDVRARHSQ